MTLLEELNQLIGEGKEFPDAIMNLSSEYKLTQDQYDELMDEYDSQCINHRIPRKDENTS